MELAPTHPPAWEQELLRLALEAGEHETTHPPSPIATQGYRLAHDLTRVHSKSFYLASALLPTPRRRAARVLYAFCRVTDDLVDHVGGDAAHCLADWRARALSPHPPPDDVLLTAWFGVRAEYRIPLTYVRQLLDGIALDLTPRRYDTFDDLARYCYGVASTVGLMAMHVVGYRDRAAIPYAVKLGVALQLTNILRDVGEDYSQGRIYLPREDFERFGYTDDALAQGVIDSRWRALLDFEIARTRRLYAEAWHGISLLAPEGRLAIAAAADLYRAILDRIVANDYNVFQRRAHLGTTAKLARIPPLWWRVRGLPA